MSIFAQEDVIIGKYEKYYSEILGGEITYPEHLPTRYDASEKSYSVLVLLSAHIPVTFAGTVATMERLSVELIPEFIMVGISNTGNTQKYWAYPDNSDKKPDEAIEIFEYLIRFYPFSDLAYLFMGEIYRNLGDIRVAKEYYLKTLNIDSGNQRARLRIGQLSINNDIHDAVKAGDLEIVKSILGYNPGLINARDKIGYTPLSIAAIYARWDIFRYLLNVGADVNIITLDNATVLHAVCHHDRPDMAALLLERGGELSLKVKDVYGEYTPMLRAVQSGCKNMVEFLLDNGASPDEATKEGWNALHLAAKCGHRHLYAMLKENGVDVDAIDKAGNKPLDYDFERPEPVSIDDIDIQEYTCNFTWEGAPEGFFVTFYLDNGKLILDDYSINELYLIGKDIFYCTKNPWKVRFLRGKKNEIDSVEFTFLRRSVTLKKRD